MYFRLISWMMSMWKKLKQLITPQTDETQQEDGEMEFVSFQSKDPIDVLFAKNFVSGGGHFFYCENEQEILKSLEEIRINEHVHDVICFEEKLISLMKRVNMTYSNEPKINSEFSFLECEYLIAYDGAIMLSSHQTNGRKLNNFPQNFIIFAKPSQLVSNISEALQRLKSSKSNNIPSNITSIRGKNMHNFDSSSNAKNIFLLLVEQI